MQINQRFILGLLLFEILMFLQVSYESESCEMPLFLRRQESNEDHRVPSLNSLQRVPSFEDLSDESRGKVKMYYSHPCLSSTVFLF